MARSPDSASTVSAVDLRPYNQAWQDLYRFLQSGESFSGRERNCCFLNVGRAHFADISAISGFDVKDDARAIGTVDWDQDGDQDLWVANRTQPRIRYFENNSLETARSVSIKLQGIDCNRDAIGARVELQQLEKGAPVYVKTVRAGSGFLAQSSRWLHFGVGASQSACVLRIHWPGQSMPEVVRDVLPTRRYTIRQNRGVVDQQPYSKRQVNRGVEFAEPELSPVARALVLNRLPFPPITYQNRSGQNTTLAGPREAATLINIWASSCVACVQEQKEFAENALLFRSLGLQVLTLNTDAVLEERSNVAGRLPEPLNGVQQGMLDRKNLRIVDRFVNSFFDLHEDLSVPISFLLDRYLRVVAIYRGRIPVSQIKEDVALLDGRPDAALAALTHLGGRWHRQPNGREDILTVANVLREVGMDPNDYFRRCLELNREVPVDDVHRLSNRELANVHFAYGTELLKRGKSREAFEELRSAVRVDPDHSQAHANLGAIFFRGEYWEQAEHHFGSALRRRPDSVDLLVNRGLARRQQNKLLLAAKDFELALNHSPNDPRALFNLALILQQTGEHQDAAKLLKRLLVLQPNLSEARYHLGWIVATSPDSEIRDGRLALSLAQQLNQSNTDDPRRLSLLAAAYAEIGRFALAVETINRAIQLATDDEQSRLQQHRALYEASKPLILNP